ncbi:hypothetical protein Patl1_07203 [Pistacia atlantica]|uniref:Uncharacterized protein n=1 Tax=Pistacia atlantica TaxID=434234 RepID=A0ACC1AHN6_9ROSI|nr:hypothetical protein Patl1_07203 [Pistacia atlantica]
MAFGADQFDGKNSEESKSKSSFFNWWYFSLSIAIMLSLVVVVYIQDNINWILGFGVPCAVMVASLVIFLVGTKTYRFNVKRNEKNPFGRISRVFVAAAKNWKTSSLVKIMKLELSSLNKTILSNSNEKDDSLEDGKMCSLNDVEDAKALLRLAPIWVTSLGYAIVFAQSTTFFTKQGATMDRTIFKGFVIPSASLQFFIGVSIVLLMPIYDRMFVPIARAITQKPSGITMLQRIGTGMLLSTISMVIAALVEMKRLETAKEYGLVDEPNATIPMSVWWLIPQYLLLGLADVFTIVGLQEFFCDQVPKDLRSFGLSLYFSIIGVGSFLSSFLVSIINKATGGEGRESWVC